MKRIGFILLFVLSGYILFAQSWVWGREASAIPDTTYPFDIMYSAAGVATDKQGNAYVTGLGEGTIAVGADTIYGDKAVTMFLTKYDSSGNVQWATTPVEGKYDISWGEAIATDDNGNIYVTGSFYDTISFGAYRLIANVQNGSVCPYIVKYSPNGNVLWAEQAIPHDLYSSGSPSSITVDTIGNIYVTGTFSDTLSFGLNRLTGPNFGVFVAKYDANGNVLWARQSNRMNGNSTGYGNSITTDVNGNVYVTGAYTDSISFGTYKLTDGIRNNIFLVKYSSGGNVLWAAQPVINYSTYAENEGASVATDNAGYIYVMGDFLDTLTLGAYVLSTNLSRMHTETFLAKYTPAGNIIWAKQTHNQNLLQYLPFLDLKTDKKNDIFMEVLADTDFTFNGYSFNVPYTPTNYIVTVCLAKLDTSGKVSCVSVTGINHLGSLAANVSPAPEPCINITTDDSGKYIYLTGTGHADTLVFNKDNLVAGADIEVPYIARWQPCTPSNSGSGGGGGGSDTNPSSNSNSGDCHNVFVPDAFTPDGAYNNILYVRGECIQSLEKFLVFDRWGNKIFESKSLNDGWSGTYGSHRMNTGTYIWYAKVTFQDGTSAEVNGNVTLLR